MASGADLRYVVRELQLSFIAGPGRDGGNDVAGRENSKRDLGRFSIVERK